MERILRYLCEQETDSTGEAWTLISRIAADSAFTREEVYAELMKVEGEGARAAKEVANLVALGYMEEGRKMGNAKTFRFRRARAYPDSDKKLVIKRHTQTPL